jgi:acetyl-CoA acetyltransferase
MTKLGNHERTGMKELFAEALTEAFAEVEKGIDPAAINEVWAGSLKTGGSRLEYLKIRRFLSSRSI